MRLLNAIVAFVALTLPAFAQEERRTAHSSDVTFDPAAIQETKRAGDRSYSPYADRKFPIRPLWGDQHLRTSWSFDAGFVCTVGVEEALRFARGEQVETTYGVPAELYRPLDWVVMTDHSHSLGVEPPQGSLSGNSLPNKSGRLRHALRINPYP